MAAVCRRPRVHNSQFDSAGSRHATDPDPPDPPETLETLDFALPQAEILGGYERELLRGGLPVRVAGTCNVCGHDARFLLRSDNFREEMVCPRCKASNRKRQVAAVLLSQAGLDWRSLLRRNLNRLPQTIWVMETGPYAEAFGAANLIASEYFSADHVPGRSYGGIRHEDAMRPSFDDDSLDAIVSCDVLEHVPDAYLAHRQLLRCLKPGGFHVFTVPFDRQASCDDVRATVTGGVHCYHKKKLYHADPRRRKGALVYRIFSMEMPARLRQLGYQVKSARVRSVRFAMLGPGAPVFVARKPAGN